MLMKSDINPFDSQETKPYKNDPRIAAMTDLVDAYQRDDIHQYESILQNNKDVMADPFIAENIDEVTRNMRTKGVMKLVAPYTRFTLEFVAKQLKISVMEVQDIICFLIVDGKLNGKIDQVDGIVEIKSSDDMGRTQAMQQWKSAIGTLSKTILNECDGFKTEEVHSLGGTATGMHMHRHDGGHKHNGFGKGKGGAKRGFDARGMMMTPG
jgi:COP9 signalosome complex subunit 2